jgi:hypothetical protein
MPGGIDNPVLGYSVFCAIKLVGYCGFAAALSKYFNRPDRNWIAVGAVRTCIGMAVGAAYYWLFPRIGDPGGFLGYVVGLAALRVAGWWALAIFYRPLQTRRDAIAITLGVLYSFLLDIPAVLGFIMTAGFWVC